GNKILLPQSALDQLARLNVSYPMLFQISNLKEPRTTHCGVLEFTAEEGFCYIPYWMMQNLVLQEGDLVRVKNVSLPKGRSVKLQPVTKDFLEIHNPRAILENSLRNFAALTAGDNIAIQYNNKTFEIEVVECKPANAISIIEADVSWSLEIVSKCPHRPQVQFGVHGEGHGKPWRLITTSRSSLSSDDEPWQDRPAGDRLIREGDLINIMVDLRGINGNPGALLYSVNDGPYEVTYHACWAHAHH
ncbi:Ubiquitin fusion degradation protein, putative, partial [Perkinsus marinus ATCC 50983]